MALLRPLLWLIAIFPPVTMGTSSRQTWRILNAFRWLPQFGGRSFIRHALWWRHWTRCSCWLAIFSRYVLGLGFIGRTIAQFLVNLAAAQDPTLPDPSSSVRLVQTWSWPLEIAVLDLFGIAWIWGWRSDLLHGRPSGSAEVPERPSPLDDRAVTPL